MTPEQYLQYHWEELRNCASVSAISRIKGAIEFALTTGVLTTEQAELWYRRISTCPGHEDEGGRSWCAFCGVLKREPKECGCANACCCNYSSGYKL